MEEPLILDRYRPLEQLASGGFGDVVLAYDTRIQRRVAIKRLPLPRTRSGAGTTPAGLAEARTAALLNHPSIVTVHEWDTDADEAFIIMEYVEGPTLGDLLDEHGALDLDAAAAVLEAVCSALEFAHDNGVLHLDIKPDNILVTRDGRVKVTDFGVAALSTASGHGPSTGGTLGYMPLEQLRSEDLDEATDVWALAAVIYELLTDANPFASDTFEGAVFKAEMVDAPAPSEFEPALPPEIDDVLLAALASDPLDRYPTVAQFSHRLLHYLGDPALGRETLAELAAEFADDHEPAPADWEHVGLWDRLSRYGAVARRGAAAASTAWLTWTALGVTPLETPALAGVTALATLAALLAPGLGVVLGLAAFTFGLAWSGFWLLAVAFGLASGLVWWFAGRQGAALGGALLIPWLGIARTAAAGPLLLGYEVSVLKTAALSAYAGALTMLASAASGGVAPYLDVDWALFLDPLGTRVTAGGVRMLVATPAPLAVVAAWALAGTIMSLACRRASRLAALGGATLALATTWVGYLGAEATATAFNASATWTGDTLLQHLAASSILVVLVIAAGPPVRAEEESLRP